MEGRDPAEEAAQGAKAIGDPSVETKAWATKFSDQQYTTIEVEAIAGGGESLVYGKYIEPPSSAPGDDTAASVCVDCIQKQADEHGGVNIYII